MKGNFKKATALLLALLTLAGSMASCGDDGNKGGTETTGNTVTTAGADEESSTLYKANIPEDINYDGYTFKLNVFPDTGDTWDDVDFSATEETGETLNDAAYKRKLAVESLLNIEIQPLHSYHDGSDMQKAVQSNTDAYDAGFVNAAAAGSLAQSGYLVELHEIETLDLSQPWWDQNAVEGLSIGNKLYMTTGDISIIPMKSVGVIIVNKQLVENDLTMPDPYELVANKTWTIEAFVNMGKKVSEDVNGDGEMDADDKYGLLYYCNLISLGIIGADLSFAEKDSDDIPQITLYSDKTVSVFEKYAELLLDSNYSLSWSGSKNFLTDTDAMFIDNRGLFLFDELHTMAGLRQMNNDFGILPIPLYDEDQEEYHHTPNADVAAMAVVPKSSLDLDRIGYVLDALGAEGKNIMTPAYYDVYLKGKGTRDTESEASLDIISSTLRYDIAYIYNVGGIGRFPMELVNNYQSNFTSQYKSKERMYKKAMQQMVEDYQENN